ncbi:uncharacterized protein TRUGW13939_04568 [Talaromyces rugulosus]|uniref:dipeptidyl-peptidase IV n=1 Tax=Talaromyces rugulosus TaxID=121627 RepID=A0A7H8QVE3_TALRU|nr:uncharacterized protein TRUGW13939_04568 [Talaromyces rugulosus]QKX57455.1 hypothetical protein TRUGW13939_04568 [Talaromyces rugulosus]
MVDKESVPLTGQPRTSTASRASSDTLSSDGSFLAHNADTHPYRKSAEIAEGSRYRDLEEDEDFEADQGLLQSPEVKPKRNRATKVLWTVASLCLGIWVVALVFFLVHKRNAVQTDRSTAAVHEADSATGTTSYGKPVTLDSVLEGFWTSKRQSISWIAGPNGEDGLLLERDVWGKKGYLRVEDIRSRKGDINGFDSRILMNSGRVTVNGKTISPSGTWPSSDLKTVLILADKEKNWRHSFTGTYWLFDVESQTAQPLDPENPEAIIQLASWSPKSDAVVFTRDNNMYLRKLDSQTVTPITKDGDKDLFYGVPDWVYEEEVFEGNGATWWSNDGNYVAFLRTNESMVPEFPVQYFMSRPSGKQPSPGLEDYPDVRQIKYPKAGAPNPVVTLQFYDIGKKDVFSVDVPGGFDDDNRLIIEVVWASNGKVLVKETNRESDILRNILVDVTTRTGKTIRTDNVKEIDGGWVEPIQSTIFVPADPENGRPEDGYIDSIIHDGYDHLGYFTPFDNPDPIHLTSGPWEVVDSSTRVDLKNGIVYFVATKESPTQRHVYSVKLDGSDFKAVTNTEKVAYYGVSFSHGGGYALLSYEGPHVPWQKVINTPSNQDPYEEVLEENKDLSKRVEQYALPAEIYQNITIDGFTLQVVERRPPHFNPTKKYPVLFYLYGGPGSQTVDRKFTVDFHSYITSSLGYIVVTVDGRGTGHIGRKARTAVRGDLGHWEAHDQIETAKAWAKKSYVDENHMAIWGWSYGGFMTLKTLEQDAGQTFQYGMAVAPVTDWRFYDSIYTERYMHTPSNNLDGYENAAISNVTALSQNIRFLVMHGVSDDNVHFQNTLALLDKLDMANVENYDVHVFPDSDHSILFHNAHKMVYDRLSSFLTNAFTDEWHKVGNAAPALSKLKRFLSVF